MAAIAEDAKTAENKSLKHLAFIMDGNGRWAQQRGKPREFGHKEGVKVLKRVSKHCKERGIVAVTAYAFSTENWKRPKHEVNAILHLLDSYLDESIRDRELNQVHYNFLGDLTVFPEKLQAKMKEADEKTREYPLNLNIALNYGGRAEIVHACNALIAEGKQTVREEDISSAVYTAGMPEVDMIVRTGGELRISNFLLWQAAYAEFYFTDTYWPDLTNEEVDHIIDVFLSRKRRFGGI